eukprot:scaffold683_cov423-Prasinococcus_capsulatus_cf.AAC.2
MHFLSLPRAQTTSDRSRGRRPCAGRARRQRALRRRPGLSPAHNQRDGDPRGRIKRPEPLPPSTRTVARSKVPGRLPVE